MGKSVMISIQPYWVFLIIVKKMGWRIGQEKTVEIRKTRPKDENWNKVAKIYCSKDKKSFAKIPNEYQALMEQFLGKVIGEFVCDEIFEIKYQCGSYRCKGLTVLENDRVASDSKLSLYDMRSYLSCNNGYGWHISNLVIYDKPRELSELYTKCDEGCENCDFWKSVRVNADEYDMECSSSIYGHRPLKRPPQSWCYVESEVDAK